jgi:hypothetical protein
LGLLLPYSLSLSGIRKSKEILLNLSMSPDAQGSRDIIVVVQVGAVKIYLAANSGGAQEKGKRKMKLQFTTKIGGKNRLGPSYFVL